jgi:hypothetical protein
MGVSRSFALQKDPPTVEAVELAYDDPGDRSHTVPTRVKLAWQSG